MRRPVKYTVGPIYKEFILTAPTPNSSSIFGIFNINACLY